MRECLHDVHALRHVVSFSASEAQADLHLVAVGICLLIDDLELVVKRIIIGADISEAVDSRDDERGVLAKTVQDDAERLFSHLVSGSRDTDSALCGREGLVTREEAEAEAQKMLHVYGDFAEKYMAVPVIKGVKSANERFAGALDTYTIEGLMQDGKALQCGTSHFLGQNFAKAFNVQFVDKNNKLDYVWATSWGVSTRLMGALIMTHSDDNGLVLPPHLAPIQVVIVPIYKNDEMLKKIDAKVEGIVNKLKAMGISVKYDNADNKRPGFKFADYELKGVPVRLVMGGRDLENNTMEVMRRDTLEKETRSCDGIEEYVQQLLEDIQNNIYQKALNYRNEHIVKVDSYDDFKEQIEKGGFILAHWDGTPETEDRIKEETKATIRCLPFDADEESLTPGKCMVTGKPSARRVLFARAY